MTILIGLILALFSGQILALMLGATAHHLWLMTIAENAPSLRDFYGILVILGLVLGTYIHGLAKDPKITEKIKTSGDALASIVTTLLATGLGCLLSIGLTWVTLHAFF